MSASLTLSGPSDGLLLHDLHVYQRFYTESLPDTIFPIYLGLGSALGAPAPAGCYLS